ncbi:MAG: nitrous oxide reductase family maturation protein NosD [Bacteroidales bacterium]|nr:nitrous oxide reductase family maturation protein NosD [Bacteroidales bacterium]
MFRWILTCFLIPMGQGAIWANNILVCPTCPVFSVKEGIRLAGPCDTVTVDGGHFAEGNLLIDKELWLIGKNWPVLDGEGKTEIITVASNHVHIEGFKIENVGTSYTEDRAAIRLQEVSDFCIKNNQLKNAFFGIYSQHSKNGIIEGNTIHGEAKEEVSSGNAIHLWYCDNIKIINNWTSGHRDGIYLEFVNSSTIKGNLSEHNVRYGLHFMFSNDDNYLQNTFRNNGAGVAVMYSKRIGMHGNLFEKNWGPSAFGLLLKEIHDSEIEGNQFQENTVGIFAETSNRIVYTKNNFIQNGWAMRISGGCQNLQITSNNFIGNSFDLAVHTSGADNKFDGNFWSDYAGYDLDHNGIGDVPHRPMKLFSHVVSQTPESMILLRSLFVDILNFSEKVSPIFTPENVVDNQPRMKKWTAASTVKTTNTPLPKALPGKFLQPALNSQEGADNHFK